MACHTCFKKKMLTQAEANGLALIVSVLAGFAVTAFAMVIINGETQSSGGGGGGGGASTFQELYNNSPDATVQLVAGKPLVVISSDGSTTTVFDGTSITFPTTTMSTSTVSAESVMFADPVDTGIAMDPSTSTLVLAGPGDAAGTYAARVVGIGSGSGAAVAIEANDDDRAVWFTSDAGDFETAISVGNKGLEMRLDMTNPSATPSLLLSPNGAVNLRSYNAGLLLQAIGPSGDATLVSESGNVSIDADSGEINIASSGDTYIRSDTTIDMTGGQQVNIQAPFELGLHVTGLTGTATLSASGGGNVTVATVGAGTTSVSTIDGTLRIKTFGSGDITIESDSGNIIMTALPTSDPVVPGALWNNSGTLSVSAAPP